MQYNIFGTPREAESFIMKKYPFVPHPFIITPPLDDKREYQKGEEISLELILVWKSIDYLSYFIYTFDELGKIGVGRGKGKYELVYVKDSEGKIIYSSQDKILHNRYNPLTIADIYTYGISSSEISLESLTPTRLKFDERLTSLPEFHILIRNLFRRLSLLSYFHCTNELKLILLH